MNYNSRVWEYKYQIYSLLLIKIVNMKLKQTFLRSCKFSKIFETFKFSQLLVWVIMSGYISRVCNSQHATLSAERSNYKETQNGKHGHCNIYHWYGRLCLPDVWAIKAGLYVYEQVQASIYNILRHIHINVYTRMYMEVYVVYIVCMFLTIVESRGMATMSGWKTC